MESAERWTHPKMGTGSRISPRNLTLRLPLNTYKNEERSHWQAQITFMGGVSRLVLYKT